MSVAAIVVAAGRGLRAGGGVPKQYRVLGGRTVLARSLSLFVHHPEVACVQPVIGSGDECRYDEAVRSLGGSKLLPPVTGGASRQASVRAGLIALAAQQPSLVLVHDAARPFASATLVSRAIAAAHKAGAALPALAVADTLKEVDATGRVVGTPSRDRLQAVQTPQGFAFEALLRAHERAAAEGVAGFTDDGALAAWAGMMVTVFEGERDNLKLTQEEDFRDAERRLARPLATRVGTGFDVHAFCAGDHVWLGGLRIPHDRGVSAHSDGDVVLHALTDALLGAIADGDIGTHFPPSDARWRGASSDRFLSEAAARVRARGGAIDHLDVTVLCEQPRIGPHREGMRQRIAAICGIPVDAVSIKATTTERLGFTGRQEGIAAQAAATIRVPS